MRIIVAVYQLETGKICREQTTPAIAVKLIQTGRYRDQKITAAEIYTTSGRLIGERRAEPDNSLPEPYREWWHDDDLQQLELLPQTPDDR